jgi:aminoglycoside-2''-adenylyltransferase
VIPDPSPDPENFEFYPWHYVKMTASRAELNRVAGLLREFPAPWFVCGGWAIDLFVGRQTREHSDLEIGIFREDQQAVRRHFLDWNPGKVVDGPSGPLIVPWYDGEWLMLPIHQVKLYRDGFSPREFEFFLNDMDGDRWLFRRMPEITLPRERLVRVADDGIPYVAPEVQLLYKARLTREQDVHDFGVAVPSMDADERSWLRRSLELFLPGHEWLGHLNSPA